MFCYIDSVTMASFFASFLFEDVWRAVFGMGFKWSLRMSQRSGGRTKSWPAFIPSLGYWMILTRHKKKALLSLWSFWTSSRGKPGMSMWANFRTKKKLQNLGFVYRYWSIGCSTSPMPRPRYRTSTWFQGGSQGFTSRKSMIRTSLSQTSCRSWTFQLTKTELVQHATAQCTNNANYACNIYIIKGSLGI